ncbi:hypothetical protein CDCA_CDCA14G3770 [Cyanidium caldarium]|uniref:Exoribonuclease phosphorolytic domain-containing protein n=1 Tax=Cyanidium caldarium TaxID=2771 RepID=A0AAV9J042_CYACA|nr:hypothetical protein CDCA_CDCA14G3770 [Cyanidium caldarium]
MESCVPSEYTTTMFGRRDGRRGDQLRRMEAELGCVEGADGSCRVCLGDTCADVLVQGPLEWAAGGGEGAAASRNRLGRGTERGVGHGRRQPRLGRVECVWVGGGGGGGDDDDADGGPEGGDGGIQEHRAAAASVIERIFSAQIIREAFPHCTVLIVVHEWMDDGGALAAAIIGTSLALMQAAVPLRSALTAFCIGVPRYRDANPDTASRENGKGRGADTSPYWADPTRAEASTMCSALATVALDGHGRVAYAEVSRVAYDQGEHDRGAAKAPVMPTETGGAWAVDLLLAAQGAAPALHQFMRQVSEQYMETSLANAARS